MFRSSPTEGSWEAAVLGKATRRRRQKWVKRTHRLTGAVGGHCDPHSDGGSSEARVGSEPVRRGSRGEAEGSEGHSTERGRLYRASRPAEMLPRDVHMEIMSHLTPPEIVCFLNASPLLRRNLDTRELWKACWYYMADEFSGAVTVNRLLTRTGLGKAFDWKMLVLLDWRFQYHHLTYKIVRSSAKEWCARIREIGLVLNVKNTHKAVDELHHLLHSLKRIDKDETASTEDEYDHDKDWEMAIVSGMALAAVRREAVNLLDLPAGLNLDRLSDHYETVFSYYRDLVSEGCTHTETDTDAGL